MGITLAAGTLFLFISNLNAGVPLERARTIALTTMVFFQFYQAFNCRSETRSVFRMSPISNPLLVYQYDCCIPCSTVGDLCSSVPVGLQDSTDYNKRVGANIYGLHYNHTCS